MGDGFLLLYKRLEDGSLTWPRTEQEAAELTEEQFQYLMLGLNPLDPKIKRSIRKEHSDFCAKQRFFQRFHQVKISRCNIGFHSFQTHSVHLRMIENKFLNLENTIFSYVYGRYTAFWHIGIMTKTSFLEIRHFPLFLL